MLAVIGRQSLASGAQIVAAHIDSPRLDLKPNPLYEDSEMAFFKTHYYGGIRKYQWVTIPLELHGVVALKDGTVVPVKLGEGDEPKFVITDLLPHLGGEQGKKPLNEAVPGESLNILLGCLPLRRGGRERPGEAAMCWKSSMRSTASPRTISPPPSWRPSPPPSPRTSAWMPASSAPTATTTACAAMRRCRQFWSCSAPDKTAVCMLADKEEIGSMGVTGMQSAAFDTFLRDLCDGQGVAPAGLL